MSHEEHLREKIRDLYGRLYSLDRYTIASFLKACGRVPALAARIREDLEKIEREPRNKEIRR